MSAGDQIGFVITATNAGAGEARGVTVTDTLPVQAGVSWSIDAAQFVHRAARSRPAC